MPEDIETGIREATSTLRTGVENLLANVDDFGTDLNKERKPLEQTIDDLEKVTLVPLLVKLKTRLNTLVAINKLPAELFIYIITLTNLRNIPLSSYHPYLSYTWVCRHWRSILVQCPAFWTTIRLRLRYNARRSEIQFMKLFSCELLRRSGSAKLDVVLISDSTSRYSKPILVDPFAEDSHRIRRLWVDNGHEELPQFFAGKDLSSLRGFALVYSSTIPNERRSLSRFLPIIATSNQLETLECTLEEADWGGIQEDQITSIFSRIHNLDLTIESPAIAASLFQLLHNITKLQRLRLKVKFKNRETTFSFQATLPELQYLSITNSSLMECFRAPKISSLNANLYSILNVDCPILKEFDFSSIRYLALRGPESQVISRSGYCIMGMKERIQCTELFTLKHEDAYEDIPLSEYPRDCFHLKISTQGAFGMTLLAAFFSIFPRLKNLQVVELRSIFPHFIICREMIPWIPSVRELVIKPGDELLNFLHLLDDPSQCPRLTHLSYTMCLPPDGPEEDADDIGRNLINCLKSRQRDSPHDQLKYIDLRNCPTLPDNCLEELRKLGIKVVTTERRDHNWGSRFRFMDEYVPHY